MDLRSHRRPAEAGRRIGFLPRSSSPAGTLQEDAYCLRRVRLNPGKMRVRPTPIQAARYQQKRIPPHLLQAPAQLKKVSWGYFFGSGCFPKCNRGD